MQKVTDPALLAQLNGGGQVAAPRPTQQSRAPGFIPGAPKQPDPYDVQQDAESDARADTNTGLSVQSGDRSQKGQVQDFRKEFMATMPVKTYQIAIQSLSNAVKRGEDGSGDVALIYDYAKAMDPESVVRESEVDMAQGGQSMIETAAARFKKEFGLEGGGVLDPKVRERLRREIINAARSRMQAYDQQRDFFADIAERNNFNADDIIGPHLGEPFREELSNFGVSGRKFTPEEMAARAGRGEAESETGQPQAPTGQFASTVNTDALGPGEKFLFDDNGVPTAIQAADGSISGYSVIEDNATERNARQRLEDNGGMDYAKTGEAGFNRGLMLGLSDEIGGVAAGLGSLTRGGEFGKGYREARDTERVAQDISREEAGIAPELLGGLLIPGGALGTAKNVGQFVRQGATVGAVSGFGEGRGAVNSLLGAGVGAGVGGALGGAISQAPRAANALMQTGVGKKVAGALAPRKPTISQDVIDAGERQNLKVRLADAVPSKSREAAVLESNSNVGQKMQDALNDDVAAFADRVGGLGGDARAAKPLVRGDMLQTASKRYIARTRTQATNLYNRAKQMGGDESVDAAPIIQNIDERIAGLKKNGEDANGGIISLLEGMKRDFTGGLTVGKLQAQRTTLRSRLEKNGLTMDPNQAQLTDTLGVAAETLKGGLSKPGARAALEEADGFYSDRQNFIKGVLKHFTDRKGNIGPELAAKRFDQFVKEGGNFRVVQKMFDELEDGERARISATSAQSLGMNAKGEFSLPIFLNNVSGRDAAISERAKFLLFGKDGVRALRDLQVLAKAKVASGSAVNNSRSATIGEAGIGKSLKDYLAGAIGLGGGAVLGGELTTVAAGATAVVGARVAGKLRDNWRLRLALNPDFTKWARQAPDTTNPAVINRYFDRLNKIASREQTFLMDAKSLQDFLAKQASEGVGRAAATGENTEDNGRK